MISSDLFKESESDTSKLFILFGFFLIASLSSKVFIETLSQRLIKDVEDTKEKVKAVSKAAGPIIAKETEPEETEEEAPLFKVRGFRFDDNIRKVLKALDGKYTWRTPRGIAREIEMTKEDVLNSLYWLSSNGFAENNEKGRWALTLEGRSVYRRDVLKTETLQQE
jgi:hypothetical protein